ncbi:SusC/RagA family TonB-linked outer membrane protein [Flagellimonas nanhaiensis]|uniref:SusC/RagA family TonB-linked outer membrane protein n=1 Tax=Flagellimonas nanhaiensis TaxID=2292706 RepID=A0A371JS31_9FLAO|nr:SusC/RagA family TonB-linked outer membrane protein [Allomuricauda nanhaiensis]RDY60631.1 SusC/RagA family TonB-linked outer membrane protein [Allomuricauda nanhaiensis]
MKVKKLFGTLVFALLCVMAARSQEKTITGTIVDQSGIPLPGVNIVVEGTTNGTQSDFDGNYAITASEGQTLVYTYIGQRAERRSVGPQNVINIQMEEDTQALEEVVVTALGIKREKQALGYAVTEVNEEQLEQRPEGDVARVLQGKASGVQIINQSGLSGSGTNVIIRGQTTFSSSNQALFIVDGVPFSTDTNSQGRQGDRNDFVNGNNGSSRFLDLDPNNIESVNVLKGLAAATLYGSQGRNGVVLITTKGASAGNVGPKKTEITVNSSIFFNEIASLPDYQNEYGNGFDQSFGWFFSNWGPSFSREGAAGWANQAAIDDAGTLEHPYSSANPATGIPQAFPEFQGARYAWRPYDSVRNFFKTGTVTNTSVNVRGGSDDGKLAYNMNYGYLKDNGFTPNNSVTRNTLSIGGRAQLSNKFTVTGTLNFARTKFVSPPVALSQGNGATGSGSSVFGDLWFTPRSIDILGLPFQNPLTGGSVYYRQDNTIQHPLWTVANAESRQDTNRVFGQAAVQYDINDNLNIIYRAGIDIYSENNTNSQNKGGINSNSGDIRLASGVYETWNNTNTIWDHNLVLNGDYDINEKIGATFNVGATSRRTVFDQNGVSSDGQQVFGILRHFNFLNQNEIQLFSERNLVGVYAQTDFDYDNFVYLTLAARNDWVSNFAVENRSQFYPSASLSFIPTAAIDGLRSENILNYLKIRGGIGVSANFESSAYPIARTLSLDTQDAQDASGTNIVTNTTGVRLGNPDLQPETLQEIELGIESRWWNSRITLDASIYKRNTNDLILDRPLDPTSGFTVTATNIGEIESEGVEIDLGVQWLRPKEEGGFGWNTNLNFTAYETTVTDLGLDTDQVVYSGFNNLGNAAIEGEPLGVLFGTRILTDDDGNYVVGADGLHVQAPTDGIIGDPNPDWVANLRNSLSYKNFTLGFQWNYTQGGDIYSSTISTLLGRGLIPETNNREDTYILPGVDSSGNPNNLQINNSTFWFSNQLFGPSELQVFDATTIRLQEASLSYRVPQKFLDNTPFGALSFTVSGQNLWFRAVNTPKGANFDPNTSGTGVGNGFGFDFINGPSSRRYGFSVKASF